MIAKKHILSLALLFLVPLGWSQTDDTFSEEETIYQIKLDRLKRLIVQDSTIIRSGQVDELKSFIADAAEFHQNGDTEIAVEFLESALLMMELDDTGTQAASDPDGAGEWTMQALTGADLWQQKFGLVFDHQDSVISESQGNPFFGLRATYDYEQGARINSRLEIEAKLSSEYNALTFMLNHNQRLGPLRMSVDNYFDLSRYKQDKELSSLADRLDFALIYQIGSIGLQLRDEIHVQKYEYESEYFPSYLQNRFEPLFFLSMDRAGRIEMFSSQWTRRHTTSDDKDYSEQWIGLNYWAAPALNRNAFCRFYKRNREYIQPESSTRLNNDFDEWFASANLYSRLSSRLALRLNGQYENRDYLLPSTSTPDYQEYVVEPSLEINVGAPFIARLGFRRQERLHTLDVVTDANPQIEDFVTYGPVLGLDIMAAGGFVASISNNYELRRYPNSPYTDDYGLSFYSDRNINSIFFFVAWNMSLNWTMNLMAHFDHDKDQNVDGSESRTNLFNFELLYKF